MINPNLELKLLCVLYGGDIFLLCSKYFSSVASIRRHLRRQLPMRAVDCKAALGTELFVLTKPVLFLFFLKLSVGVTLTNLFTFKWLLQF